MKNMFLALRHRNFRLFFIGQAVSLIGFWMQNTAQSWLVYDLTKPDSSFWLGLIGFMGSLPVLLFSLFGGAVADRIPKRPLILGLQSILMLLALALGLLTFFVLIKLWHVAFLALLLGLVNAFEMPARQSFIVEMVGKKNLGNAIALNATMFNSARLIGGGLTGILMVSMGAGICFLVNSASYLAVITSLLFMKLLPLQKVEKPSSIFQSTLDGLRYIRHTPPVLALVVLVGIMTIFGWSYSVLMPIFADQILGAGPGGLGWLVSCNGMGALTAGLTLAAIHNGVRPRVLSFTGIGIFCVSVTALALSRVFWLSALCMVFVGFGLVTFFATSNITLQRWVPDNMRGRVMGIYSFVFIGFFPLGSLQAGMLAHLTSAPIAVFCGAVVCAVATLTLGRFAGKDSAAPPSPDIS